MQSSKRLAVLARYFMFILFSGVYYCDITMPETFVVPVGQFDVIIASLVFDVVAITDKMYIDALQNVLQFLKVRGMGTKLKSKHNIFINFLQSTISNIMIITHNFISIAWRCYFDPWKSA